MPINDINMSRLLEEYFTPRIREYIEQTHMDLLLYGTTREEVEMPNRTTVIPDEGEESQEEHLDRLRGQYERLSGSETAHAMRERAREIQETSRILDSSEDGPLRMPQSSFDSLMFRMSKKSNGRIREQVFTWQDAYACMNCGEKGYYLARGKNSHDDSREHIFCPACGTGESYRFHNPKTRNILMSTTPRLAEFTDRLVITSKTKKSVIKDSDTLLEDEEGKYGEPDPVRRRGRPAGDGMGRSGGGGRIRLRTPSDVSSERSEPVYVITALDRQEGTVTAENIRNGVVSDFSVELDRIHEFEIECEIQVLDGLVERYTRPQPSTSSGGEVRVVEHSNVPYGHTYYMASPENYTFTSTGTLGNISSSAYATWVAHSGQGQSILPTSISNSSDVAANLTSRRSIVASLFYDEAPVTPNPGVDDDNNSW